MHLRQQQEANQPARKWTDTYGIYGASYVSIHEVVLHLGDKMASDDDDVPGLFTLIVFHHITGIDLFLVKSLKAW